MNPLSSKSLGGEGPKPPHASDKKLQSLEEKTDKIQKNTIQEAKTSKLEHVANLQRYKESKEEPDIPKTDIETIFHALTQYILPLDKDSVFSDTDLILIHDSFKGMMPLNGIKKSDLRSIEQLFKNICDGKEKIIISTKASAAIKTLLKLLLTRNIGRKLIQKILDNPSLSKIEILSGEKSQVIRNEKNPSKIKLILQANVGNILAHHPVGKLKIQDLPLHIILAHEFIHISHMPNLLTYTPPTFSHMYTNLEEQLTITGL